jgi:hypothetical protein
MGPVTEVRDHVCDSVSAVTNAIRRSFPFIKVIIKRPAE